MMQLLKNIKKEYRQIEAFCDICQCKVKKCRVFKHLKQTSTLNMKKHEEKEEKKLQPMNEEEQDDYLKIKQLQTIWKAVTVRSYDFKTT